MLLPKGNLVRGTCLSAACVVAFLHPGAAAFASSATLVPKVHGSIPWYLPQGVRTVRVLHDVSYVDVEVSKKQRLDLYVPVHGKPVPVVVWIHGGSWKKGDKRWGPFRCLLDAGFAVASVNYRLSGEAPFPAQVQDCKAAVRWLRAHARQYNLDGGRIGVWGSSAGAHLAMLLGTTSAGGNKFYEGELGNASESSAVQAVVDWFGPTFLVDEKGTVAKRQIVRKLLQSTRSEKSNELVLKARAASPLYQAAVACPPILIMHGDRDRLVPFEHGEKMHTALLKKGADSTLFKVAGGHGFPAFGPAEQEAAVQFLVKTLCSDVPSCPG